MPPKRSYRASPAPTARHNFPPYSSPSQPPVFGWLLCVLSSIGGRLRSRCILYLFFSIILFAAPNNGTEPPPHAPSSMHLNSNTPPTAFTNYRVDCCFSSPNDGRLRPELSASLYFCVCPILALQLTGKSALDTPRLLQTHREWRCQDLGLWQMLPWRERTKAAGG